MRLVPVSVLSCLLVAGCFSSTAVHDCPGEGTYVEAGVGRYCAYGVVIGGFDCPPELPNRFDYPSADPFLPDAMICADRPMDSPDDVPPEVCAFMPACRVGTPGAGGRDASADAGIDPTWTEQAKLTGSDASADALFGFSVAVSGDTAVAGAVWDDVAGTYRGSTYVFVRSGAAWSQQAKLIASGAAPGDEFGASVAVSGDTVVVGAPARDNEGSVYVFVRSGTTWTEQAMLTASDAVAYRFGSSVAVSGDTVVVAGPSDGVNDGSVYVFVRSGTTWTEQAKLTASDAARGLLFGQSVAVSGDTAVVGSNQRSVAGTYSGSAYVFVRSGTTWSQQAKLTASDAAWGDVYLPVAVSGDTAVMGVNQYNDDGSTNSSAYVFVRSGTTWSQQAKLTTSDAALGDQFHISVAVSGDRVVVGALETNNPGLGSGSVYLFVRSGATWTEQAKLTASDATRGETPPPPPPEPGWNWGDDFGISVAVSGDTAVVGAARDDTTWLGDHAGSRGSAYVFALDAADGSRRAP